MVFSPVRQTLRRYVQKESKVTSFYFIRTCFMQPTGVFFLSVVSVLSIQITKQTEEPRRAALPLNNSCTNNNSSCYATAFKWLRWSGLQENVSAMRHWEAWKKLFSFSQVDSESIVWHLFSESSNRSSSCLKALLAYAVCRKKNHVQTSLKGSIKVLKLWNFEHCIGSTQHPIGVRESCSSPNPLSSKLHC